MGHLLVRVRARARARARVRVRVRVGVRANPTLILTRYMGHLLGVAEAHNPCAGSMGLAKARL
jgi:hypothetical protein